MRRLSLTARNRPKKSGQNIPKNRCRTTIAERVVETLAELPFIGDQVSRAGESHPCALAEPDVRLSTLNYADVKAFI